VQYLTLERISDFQGKNPHASLFPRSPETAPAPAKNVSSGTLSNNLQWNEYCTYRNELECERRSGSEVMGEAL
jgi:hypothetical protein